MKKIRTITTAMMLSASLLGTATYALTPGEGPEKVESGEISTEAQGINGNTPSVEDKDQMSAEEASASAGLEAANAAKETDRETKRDKKKSDSSSTNWLGIIALVVGAGGVAIGMTNRKSLENLDKNNKELKNSSAKSFEEMKGRIDGLQQELANAQQTIARQNSNLAALRKAQASLSANMSPSYDQQTVSASETPAQHYQAAAPAASQQAAPQTIRIYCGAPNGGVFTNTSRTSSNKTLYIITYNPGDATSTYSFVDTRDGAMLAARSISDFLEPGCVVSGTKNPNFTKVKTIKPGTVRRQANGCWAIEEKAIVELI